MIAAALSYITSGILVKSTKMAPLALASGTLLMGSLQLVPVALVFSGYHPTDLSQQGVFALLFLGLFPTGLAYILRYHLIQTVGYSMVAFGINALPVLGVMVAALALGESISITMAVALLLVIGGILIARSAPVLSGQKAIVK